MGHICVHEGQRFEAADLSANMSINTAKRDRSCVLTYHALLLAIVILNKSIGETSAADLPSQHAWFERFCIDWFGERKCFRFLDVTSDKMNALVTGRLTSLCAQSASIPEAFACCTKMDCIEKYHEAIFRRLRWGARVSNPAVELSARRIGLGHHGIFDLALQELLAELDNDKTDKHILVLQVGPHVGALQHDPIYPYIMMDQRIRALLFEPASPQYEALTYNYRKAGERVKLVHAAVCDHDGKTKFRQSRIPAGNPLDPAIHEDIDKLSPLYDYLYRTMHSQAGSVIGLPGRDIDAADQRLGDDSTNYTETPTEWTEVIVQCARLSTHLPVEGWQLPYASVLVIDAEGSDLIVLREALCGNTGPVLYPRIVIFEHTGLNPDQQYNALTLLDHYGYICEPVTMLDVMCTRQADQKNLVSPHPACCLLDSKCAPSCLEPLPALPKDYAASSDWNYCKDPLISATFPTGHVKGTLDIKVDGTTVGLKMYSMHHPKNDATIAALQYRILVHDFSKLSSAMISLWQKSEA